MHVVPKCLLSSLLFRTNCAKEVDLILSRFMGPALPISGRLVRMGSLRKATRSA